MLLLASLAAMVTALSTSVKHPSVKIKTGMAYMKSSTDKLFGVGVDGHLYERIYQNGWHWVHHGNHGEKLATTPCILQDGSVFIISETGNLFQRVWWQGAWHWKNHFNPGISLRRSTCACTNTNGLGRVFVVGDDLKLHERYWNHNINGWSWRSHGSPSPSILVGINIDTCNRVSGCATEVYTAGSDGNVWRRRATSLITFVWEKIDRPYYPHVHNEFAHSVRVQYSVQGLQLYTATKTDNICKYHWHLSRWGCYGKPDNNGYTLQPQIEMSKPVWLPASCHWSGGYAGWYIFINSWDPVHFRRGRFVSFRRTSPYHYVEEENFSAHGAKIGAPEVVTSANCMKVFTVNSNGDVWERL